MKQFDLEQDIMQCWDVTSDLDILHKELLENDSFTKVQASNFVLGLSTIYEAKFSKLFRTFEDFLKEYYRVTKQLEATQQELSDLQDEMDAIEEANEELTLADDDTTLEDLFIEEEEKSLADLLEENDRINFVEEEGSLF